jgi:hypothetical protein
MQRLEAAAVVGATAVGQAAGVTAASAVTASAVTAAAAGPATEFGLRWQSIPTPGAVEGAPAGSQKLFAKRHLLRPRCDTAYKCAVVSRLGTSWAEYHRGQDGRQAARHHCHPDHT